MEWEVEGKFRRDETYAYLWLIHLDLGQKPTQHCKEIILQFKNKFLKNSKKKNPSLHPFPSFPKISIY